MGRVVEQMQGEGDVDQDGKRIGDANYHLTVYQETQTIRTMEGSSEIDGMREISGTVELKSPLSDFTLMGKTLTLHLEDGRLWDFFLKNNHGAAVNTGEGLRKP